MNTAIAKQGAASAKAKRVPQIWKLAAIGLLWALAAAPTLGDENPTEAATEEGVAASDLRPAVEAGPQVRDESRVADAGPVVTEPKAKDPAAAEPRAAEPTVVPAVSPDPAAQRPAATQPTVVPPAAPQPVAAEPPAPQPSTQQPVWPAPAPAAAPAGATTRPADGIITSGLSPDGNINLTVGKSTRLLTRGPFNRVFIVNKEIAVVDLVPHDAPTEIVVTGIKPGSTQLIVYDAQERSQSIDVVVGFDLRGLEGQLHQMFPKGTINAESANGVIVLRGHVPDLLTAQRAAQVATPYSAGLGNNAVLNFLEVSGGQQVMLQVRFAEVSRQVSRNLGFNVFATDGRFSLGFNNGPGGSPIGGVAGGMPADAPASIPLFASSHTGAASFEYFLNALRQNSLLRILAEPNLTAVSGQQASFLAGGEFPVPVPQAGSGGTSITIEYKQYGIQLNFTPTVLGDGRVRLQCTPAVSELDYSNSVSLNGYTIPGLTTRNVNTTVELAEGQSFTLAGLLQNQIKASKNVTPLLGDVPVLGALFRSVNYQRNETELVVLVTPRLVEAMNPAQLPPVPGELWREPTEAQLFVGGDLGGPAPDLRHAPTYRTGRFYGPTGFNPPTTSVSTAK